MGRLVRINPATEEKNSQAAVVATGAHGRLVRTGDVQRTSPAGNTVKLPSRETERADELDKRTTPSKSRQGQNRRFGERLAKAAGSGLVAEGANLANIGGVATDRRGGTEMSAVYRRQAETLDKQIAALEKSLKDPTMTAQDIRETNEALAIARSEREKYGKVIESGEKTALGLYDTADKGYSFAQKLSEESTAGTKGIKKGVLSIVPAATQIGLQTAERMVAPGMDVAGRALSVAGGNAADYRRKAGEQYDAEKATLRATVSALGVAAGGALSKGVNAAGLKLLRAAGKQNHILPNVLLGGANAVGYAAGETGASELSKAMTEEDYTPDWNAIGQTALTAFAFGAISSAINAAAITGRNKKYMNELNDAAKERYDYAKRIIEDPRATAEQKAAGAQSVMDAVDKMRYTLDDLQVVGAQKEVDAMREFLLSIYGEMMPYTGAGSAGAGTAGIAPVTPGGGIMTVRPGDGANPMQEAVPPAPITPRAAGAAAAQNTMPAQPAAAQEGAQGVGKGNLTPVPQNAAQGAQEASTSVDTNPKNHTPEEQKRVEDYRAATDSGIVAFVQKVRTLKNPRYRNSVRYPVSDVSAREASAVLDATGVNTSGFTNILTGGAVDHIEKRHGASGKADKSMQDLNDLGRVGYILENFDGAELLLNEDGTPSVSDVWKNSDGTPAARMLFTKKVDGVYYTAVATPDSNAGVIAIESAFMSKEKGSTGTVLNMENISPQVTPEAPQRANASFDNTVPQESGGVKAQEGTESAQTAQADNTMTAGGMNHGGQEVQNYAGGSEPAEGTRQRADAVAAENDLHGGDRGRRPPEPGAGGAGELRSTTAEGRRRNRELTQRRREIAWEQPLTSAAALGVQGGTSDETLHVLPEESWDDELRGFSDWARGKGVKRVTMVTGLLQVETENGPVGVRGIINRESGEMVLRVDGEKRTASEIGKHEVGHLITEEENVRTFMETVRGGADWRGIYEVYERCYEPLTNGYVGMTAEERELYVWEEIMEDAYAGIDSYGQRASRYHDQATRLLDRVQEAPAHTVSEPENVHLRAVDEPKGRGPPERFSVEKTDDGRAVAVVDDDILSGIDTQTWDKTKKAQAKAAAKAALLTFKDGIQVNGIDYKVNRTSRREYTRSEDTERLYREDKAAFADKMRAAANADDIITATTDWTRDGTLTHPRTDSFVDFAHGDVLIQSGNNQYDARVVVGITSGGEYVFYDVVDMEPTSFAKKEETPTTALSNKALGDIHGASLDDSISKGSENVKYSAFNEEVARQLAGEDREKTKSDIRFSLEEPVEETKTLVAMHNMTEEKLRRTLDIGAWPSPSIAVVKAKEGHANYGEYSAVFPRGTIDPQADSKNKVYGGDAWTPTHDNAIVERGVNYEARRAFDENIKNLSSQFAGGVFQGSGTLGKIGLENETRWEPEEIADKLANHPEVQAAFLQSEGKSLEPVYRDKQFDRVFSNATIRRYLDTVGEQEVARLAVKLMTGERLTAEEMKPAEQAIREVYAEEHANFLNRRPESKEKRIDYYMKNNVFPNRVEDFIRSTQEFYESGGSAGEIDKEATAAKMFELIAPSGSQSDALRTVKDWVKPQLEGLLGERGIYNGKDAVTDRGRRSFAETHWDYTAENIVKAMNMAAAKGANVYGITPETLAATATQEYKTVDEMHADEARLRTVSEEEHAKALRDLGIYLDRVVNDLMLTTMHKYDNSFEEEQNLSGIIAEAAKGKKTVAAVKAAFRKEGYAISDGHARSILALIDRAANIPTGYYEAKPQRVVGFDEALAVVAPDNAPADLLGEMRNAGMNVVEYKAGDEADRLAKVNSIKNVRFSAEDEGDEWNRELERMPESVQEAVRRVKGSRGGSMREFPNLDAYLSDKGARLAAEKAERLRDKGKDEFKGTEALEKLGVKIENSAGDYSNVEQLIANDRAAKTIQRETRKAIKRLGATPKEQNFARNIASGLYDEADIPATMNRGKVVELADYYSAEQSMSTDFIRQRRAEINENLQEKMKDLFDEHFDGEFTKEKSGKGISPESGFALYHRTPQRSMRAIFGWDRGQQINEAIFEPVYVNEQERKRFVNRMHDEVRTFKGADGEDAALTQRERALAQLMIEGKAVEEMVGKSEIKQQIIHAAENLLDGAEMKDAAQEFGLHGKEERELAQRYADWLETKRELDSGEVDRVRVENAAAKYSGLYNEFYAAINDFLVAHGYEPIGFIKGYAPHFQPEAESGKLERALKAIGVDLGAEVGKLPASIAGLTKEFKPNKRYNPFFQHRNGKSTDYDIQKGFEKYVDYLSDVLYHTDDIMRTRAASKYFRKKYAPDEIGAQIQQAEDLKFATAEEKELFLKTNGIVDDDVKLSYQAMNRAMEQYTEGLFNDVTQTTKYGDLVTWLDDYGNKLAGKQLFNDRSMEREVGRTSLNVGRKLVSTFARANVAGNLSSSLNQTAQLTLIAGELGPKYVAEAIGDIASGKAKGDFADRSDFLTEKRGIRYLTNTKGDKFTTALFWPLERMDYLMSTIAVRGRYRKELAEGKSEKEALRAADRWGRDVMGSRSKGTAPLTFQSKNLISQMVNLFQVEALNSWEHVTQDLCGPGLREMEEKLGKKEASRRLAGIIVGTLLGAFILNRVDEELYGGTPAQFDVLGLLTGFLASGNGLSTNEQLGVWVDDVWQKMTGERLFGTDEDAGNGKFNLAAATEDTIYNISNDIPYARNVAGVFGVGDQTLPMPDLWGTATGIGGAFADAAEGDMLSFSEEIARQLMGLAGDTLPGGRQAEKTAQGIEAVARGGSYKGSGDNKRLQYPVNSPLEDPWTALRAAIFGKNALPESRTYWAAGGKALSAAQTRTYQELVDMGADREVVYDAIQKWRKIDKDDSLTDGEREAAQFELVRKLKLTNEQKERLHDDLSRSSRSYAAAQEAQKQGISAETYAEYKDTTADLTADKDENGKAINGSKKAKVLDAIDKMQLSKKQKDWMYLDAGYSEKDIGKAPWNS